MHLAKSGGLKSWKALDFKKWGGGSSLAALQKFMPMVVDKMIDKWRQGF